MGQTQKASCSVMFNGVGRTSRAVSESPANVCGEGQHGFKKRWRNTDLTTTSLILQRRKSRRRERKCFSLWAHLCQAQAWTPRLLMPGPTPPLWSHHYGSCSLPRVFSLSLSSFTSVILFYPRQYSSQKCGTGSITPFYSEEDEFQKDKGVCSPGENKDLRVN